MNCAWQMTWPGAVPISRKCEACDGKGSTTLNPSTRTFVSEDGLIAGTMLFGTVVLCRRCIGGRVASNGTRGRSFTPLVRKSRCFRRIFNCLGFA